MLVLIAGGLWLADQSNEVAEALREDAWQISLHKTLGLVVFALTALRLISMFKGSGYQSSIHGRWQTTFAYAVQAYFLCVLIALPVTGMIMHRYQLQPALPLGLPITWFQSDGTNPVVVDLMTTVHRYLSWAMVVALFLHVVGALRHHLHDGDNTLVRMLKSQPIGVNDDQRHRHNPVPPGGTPGRLIGILVAGTLAIAAGILALIAASSNPANL